MRTTMFGLVAFLAACGGPSSMPTAMQAPALGKADSLDAADRDCRVVLRQLQPAPRSASTSTLRWDGVIDVAHLAGDVVEVGALIPDASGAWYFYPATLDGSDAVFAHYALPLVLASAPTEIAIFARFADGTRRFDHNRISSDFANYTLDTSDTIAAAPAVCPSQTPRGELDFRGDFTTVQRGPLVPGGTLTVKYALERLPTCRRSRAGAQLWDIEAWVKFQPQGIVVTQSTSTVSGGTRTATPFTVEIPRGTQNVELWFRNYSAEQTCETWDSNYGNDYWYAVAPLGEAVVWAGDWGGSFARDCAHRDGLAEPITIDSYVRERACKWVDADVYVPGLTDGSTAHPERLWAEVEWQWDGVAQPAVPLQYVERAGNNARYRWQLPYELTMAPATWTAATYRFRFSHDGNTWYRIGQADGPDGGAPRTIRRGF